MCGIAAVVWGRRREVSGIVEQMIAAQTHRGPDDQGVKELPGCYMGHARLSIIDLEGGHQPMTDQKGSHWITYNGELYNFRELRVELERLGHRFYTQSDTEVILASFTQWGEKCLDRFRGMFVFGIWDTEQQRLFVARDLFGEKPCYFAEVNGKGLVVSSELKGIMASGLVEPKLDLRAVDGYLARGYVPPDRSIYRETHTLPPGNYLIWQGCEWRLRSYWRPVVEKCRLSLADAAERLDNLFKQAVHRQMVADVPIGAFLSGGLDSSTIVAMMRHATDRPVRTFSVGFGEEINELPYARAVAARYNTEHHEIDLGCPDVVSLLKKMAGVYDEPFADSSHIPTYLLSGFAREQVPVVLTGDGGDELFGGYAWHIDLEAAEREKGSWLKWMLLRMAGRVLQRLERRAVAVGLATRWKDPWEQGVMWQTSLRSAARQKLWGNSAFVPYTLGDYYRPPNGTEGVDRALYFDLTAYLPGDIMVKVDRTAMAHGLETRAPFLDRDLAEFALSLPANLKVEAGEGKRVLRSACKKYWPEELHTRAKQGFGVPYPRWLRLPEVESLKRRVFARDSQLRELLPGIPTNQQLRTDYPTWILLTLGLWLEAHEVQW